MKILLVIALFGAAQAAPEAEPTAEAEAEPWHYYAGYYGHPGYYGYGYGLGYRGWGGYYGGWGGYYGHGYGALVPCALPSAAPAKEEGVVEERKKREAEAE